MGKLQAITILLLLFCAGFARQGSAQDSLLSFEHPERPPTMDELLQWKEVFTYEVKYGFLKLATVKTEIVQDTTYRGHHLWWLKTIIKSNSSVPFMGKEENHYNTFFVATDSLPHTRLFWRDNVDEEEFNDQRYRFDYEEQRVYYSESGARVDTFKVTEPSISGHLFIYYSRLLAGLDKKYRLPVYIDQEKGYIRSKASSKTDMREYAAFSEPVKTYYANGDVDFEGPFGFSGEFEAWYLADDLRIPAEAHAKVFLGNVKVKLVNYQKEPRN